MLDACEERAQPKRIEHRVEYRRRHELRLAEALPVAMPERNHDVPAWFGGDKWLERLDKRFALAERLAQPPNVVGLAVVEPGKRPDAQQHPLPRAALAVGRAHALALDQPQVVDSVVVVLLDVHRRSFM